jgi:putative solute:sodium symporter small subunit
MLKRWHKVALAKVLPGNERLEWGELKRVMLTALTAWLAYFLVVNMFVRTLNKVIIPVLDMPLGVYLAVQGTVIVFAVAVYVIARRMDESSSS